MESRMRMNSVDGGLTIKLQKKGHLNNCFLLLIGALMNEMASLYITKI